MPPKVLSLNLCQLGEEGPFCYASPCISQRSLWLSLICSEVLHVSFVLTLNYDPACMASLAGINIRGIANCF